MFKILKLLYYNRLKTILCFEYQIYIIISCIVKCIVFNISKLLYYNQSKKYCILNITYIYYKLYC